MERRLLVMLVVAIVLLGAVGLSLTGLVTLDTQHGVTIAPDAVSIDASSLETCCTFVRDGRNRTCAVLAPYDCGYCAAYC